MLKKLKAIVLAVALTTGLGAGSYLALSLKQEGLGQLSKTVLFNDLEKVQSLLSEGAPIHENLGGPNTKITPIMIAVTFKRDDAIVESLLAHGASPSDHFLGLSALDIALAQEESLLFRILTKAF